MNMKSDIELKDKSIESQGENRIEDNIDSLGANVITLPRPKRWLIFSILILLNILMSIDHGTIPAATVQIRLDLDINDAILGVFGSLVYAGSILGSLLSISLINSFNRKHLLIASITLCGFLLLLFTIKQHYVLLFINRTLVGSLQSFIAIYLPVWCDQLGIESRKTMMLAMVQLCSIIGVVLGYSLTTLFSDKYGWKISFVVEAISTILLSLSLTLFSNDFFKSTLRRNNRLSNRKTSYFYDEALFQAQGGQEMTDPPVRQDKGIAKILKQFSTILREPVFVFSVATFASLLFIVTCIQYWGADYMMETLLVQNENKRLLSFALVSLTSPTLGVILGGILVTFIGGYESKHSIFFCLCSALLSFLFTIPAPLVNALLSYTIILWIVLFFGGAIIAPINGIIITSVPKDHAGSANSISHFFCNLLGKLPAPYVYGAFKTYTSGRVAMSVSMWLSLLSVVFLAVAAVFRYRHYAMMQRSATDSPDFLREGDRADNQFPSGKEEKSQSSATSKDHFIKFSVSKCIIKHSLRIIDKD